MLGCRDIAYVLDKLNWMRAERIWPNGQRYTWTDAFGVVLLVSLYAELGKPRFLDEAEWVVSEVDRVLGRPRGIRIGEAPDRDGQYFHYLAMWIAIAVGASFSKNVTISLRRSFFRRAGSSGGGHPVKLEARRPAG